VQSNVSEQIKMKAASASRFFKGEGIKFFQTQNLVIFEIFP
jgi:hypothetical protein